VWRIDFCDRSPKIFRRATQWRASYQQLQQEGRRQQHCVAAYHQDIVKGAYFVYRVLKPERATVGIKIKYAADSKVTLQIDQLRGNRNNRVSPATKEAVLNWFQQGDNND